MLRRWLPFVGFACILSGAVFYYVMWKEHAEAVQVYKLVLAGRLSTTSSGKASLVPSVLALQEAQMFLIAAVVLGAALIALTFWNGFWQKQGDRV